MSRPSIVAYLRPQSVDEAWDHVSEGPASTRLLSGGTDLTISAPADVDTLVDLAACVDDRIEEMSDGSIRIGAMATFTHMLEHSAMPRYAGGVIPEMLSDLGSPLLRNISTIGGHLARGKLSDVIPVMIALDAVVGVYTGGHQDLALQRYYDEGFQEDPHILTHVTLPPRPEKSAAAFLRFARNAFDFPMVNVCSRIDMDGHLVGEARVVCGATPFRFQRAMGAEAWIREHGISERAIEAAARRAREEIRTRDGWVASAEYRSHLVEVLTRQSLDLVAQRLEIS